MKKISVILLLFLASCTCAAEKRGVEAVEATGTKINAKLMKYVDADPALDAGARDDWKKMIESWQRDIDSLKKSLK